MPKDDTTSLQAVDELVQALDSRIFTALGEPVRAQILKFLVLHGRSDINTIAEQLPQDRSVISRHLSLMAKAGLLHATKETRHVYYSINGQAILQEFENIVDSIKNCLVDC
jgi:DNA-binding transcriptional ArsR family regulator